MLAIDEEVATVVLRKTAVLRVEREETSFFFWIGSGCQS